MRILLVEDERRVASVVSRALRENAYIVDLAETGEKALELATQTSYDSILLDVRLPGVSGIEVCRELRKRACRHANPDADGAQHWLTSGWKVWTPGQTTI